MQTERLEKIHPYRASLNRITQIGIWTAAIFEATYSTLYWFAGPRMAAWICITGVAIVVLSAIIFKYGRPLFAAHLLTLSLYITVIGVSMITGGVDASSIPWLAFVGAVAALMTGVWGGVMWESIAILSLVAVYIAQTMGMLDALAVRPSTSFDRLTDSAGLILVIGIATIVNEYTRRNVLFELNQAQTTMRHLAIMDPLTRAYNRRHFLEWIAQWSKDSSRTYENAALILFDVDHFKTVNDTHGHLVGDQILCGIADLCAQTLRTEDVFARFGGEEFVIFLPGADLLIGEQIAERLRAMIASVPIQTEIGPTCVTISLGVVATSTPANFKLNEFIRRADQAMYHSKRLGRNRVTKWNEGIAPKRHA